MTAASRLWYRYFPVPDRLLVRVQPGELRSSQVKATFQIRPASPCHPRAISGCHVTVTLWLFRCQPTQSGHGMTTIERHPIPPIVCARGVSTATVTRTLSSVGTKVVGDHGAMSSHGLRRHQPYSVSWCRHGREEDHRPPRLAWDVLSIRC